MALLSAVVCRSTVRGFTYLTGSQLLYKTCTSCEADGSLTALTCRGRALLALEHRQHLIRTKMAVHTNVSSTQKRIEVVP